MGAAPRGASNGSQLHRRSNQPSTDWIPLIWAAKANHAVVASRLIDTGTSVNVQESDGQGHSKYGALHWAAMRGHVGLVELLLHRGADVHLRDKHANTPLMLAEKNKKGEAAHKAIVDLLEAAARATPVKIR